MSVGQTTGKDFVDHSNESKDSPGGIDHHPFSGFTFNFGPNNSPFVKNAQDWVSDSQSSSTSFKLERTPGESQQPNGSFSFGNSSKIKTSTSASSSSSEGSLFSFIFKRGASEKPTVNSGPTSKTSGSFATSDFSSPSLEEVKLSNTSHITPPQAETFPADPLTLPMHTKPSHHAADSPLHTKQSPKTSLPPKIFSFPNDNTPLSDAELLARERQKVFELQKQLNAVKLQLTGLEMDLTRKEKENMELRGMMSEFVKMKATVKELLGQAKKFKEISASVERDKREMQERFEQKLAQAQEELAQSRRDRSILEEKLARSEENVVELEGGIEELEDVIEDCGDTIMVKDRELEKVKAEKMALEDGFVKKVLEAAREVERMNTSGNTGGS